MPVDVCLEEGRRRTFAIALAWPGWARSGTSHGAALDALASYRGRYGDVLGAHGLALPRGTLRVVEVVEGGATTDFGAPTAVASGDDRPLRAAERAHLVAILEACWDALAALGPRTLTTGPRGGGRSFEAVGRHVADAEVAYARKLGLRVSDTKGDATKVAALRRELIGVVTGEVTPVRDSSWPLRTAVRRLAWHALDHCFEIEDRTR